jgi:hypothetical protein
MSDEIDAEVSAYDGYINGRNLELVPAERIVQSWRTTQFTDEHEDSVITVTLEDADTGALLTLVHTNVPDDQISYEQGGWEEYYFEPMKAYFSALRGRSRKARTKPRAKQKSLVKKAKPKHKATTKAGATKSSKKPRAGNKKAKVERAVGPKRRARRR